MEEQAMGSDQVRGTVNAHDRQSDQELGCIVPNERPGTKATMGSPTYVLLHSLRKVTPVDGIGYTHVDMR